MNKKIKMIGLLNMIANGEDLPKRIKIQDYVFELSKDYEHYYYNEDVEITHLINHNFSNLNDEVEILEDNTEEIEELPDYNYSIKENRDKINELVRRIKYIERKINDN